MNKFDDLELLLGMGAKFEGTALTKKQQKRITRATRNRRYSANLVVDIGNTCISQPSIPGSGGVWVQSGQGALIGLGVNMMHSDTFCNLCVTGMPYFTSGQLRVVVQCANSDTSGNYTDPTSGLSQMPTSFSSGGVLIINSGGVGSGVLNTGASGQNFASGWQVFAGFQRTGVFVRAIVLSGTSDFFAGELDVGFVSQQRTTGSGGGFSYQPGSGTINV